MMSELDWQIENLACEGASARAIADELLCPIDLVIGKLKEMGIEEDCSPYATVNS
jgi:hypothetical protein